MKVIKALQIVFESKKYIFLALAISALTTFFYYLAITENVEWRDFINANETPFVIAQISLSLINAILIGIAISMFVFIVKKHKEVNELSIFQTLTSILFSVATTGCYVCGTVLLPTIGIATSFTSLPFGGLEIKTLTILLLLYSINQYTKTILGLCKVKRFKKYKLELGGRSYLISSKLFDTAKPLLISFTFIIVIFILPSFFNTIGVSEYKGANESYQCNISSKEIQSVIR